MSTIILVITYQNLIKFKLRMSIHKLFIFNRTGRWDLSADVCQLTSTLNLTVWLQHMLVFAMLKIDKGPNTNIDGKAVEHILQCSDSLPIASPPAE